MLAAHLLGSFVCLASYLPPSEAGGDTVCEHFSGGMADASGAERHVGEQLGAAQTGEGNLWWAGRRAAAGTCCVSRTRKWGVIVVATVGQSLAPRPPWCEGYEGQSIEETPWVACLHDAGPVARRCRLVLHRFLTLHQGRHCARLLLASRFFCEDLHRLPDLRSAIYADISSGSQGQ